MEKIGLVVASQNEISLGTIGAIQATHSKIAEWAIAAYRWQDASAMHFSSGKIPCMLCGKRGMQWVCQDKGRECQKYPYQAMSSTNHRYKPQLSRTTLHSLIVRVELSIQCLLTSTHYAFGGPQARVEEKESARTPRAPVAFIVPRTRLGDCRPLHP